MRQIIWSGAALHRYASLAPIILVVGTLQCLSSPLCRTSDDPSTLLISIANAEKASKISTDVLKLMLPCPGSTVSVQALTAVLDAGFSAEQTMLIVESIKTSVSSLNEIVEIVKTSASEFVKDRILGTVPPLLISYSGLQLPSVEALTSPQLDMVAKHIRLGSKEGEIQLLLSLPLGSNQEFLVRKCLQPRRLTAENSVLALMRYPHKGELAGKLSIASPALWAYTLNNGAGPEELLPFVSDDVQKLADVLVVFQQHGVSNDVAARFIVLDASKIRVERADVDRLSKSSLTSAQLSLVFGGIKHAGLQLDPATVVRLKLRGVQDEVIISLTKARYLSHLHLRSMWIYT